MTELITFLKKQWKIVDKLDFREHKENKKKELHDREGTGVSACSFPACRDGHKCVFAFVKGHF